MSSTWIHGRYCLPLPIGPPTPSLNGSFILLSAPPSRASTTPVRSRHAGALALRLQRQLLPAGAQGVSKLLVARIVLGHHHIAGITIKPVAEPEINRRGGLLLAWISETICSVICQRLSHRRCFCSVQRLSAIGSPARLMTPSQH